jgi:hypothetical protein
MRDMSGIAACFTFGELTDEGLPVVCETDIHGAITSVIAQAATGWQKASFFADITIRHPTNDNAELFWHCGVFPRSTASCASKPCITPNFDEGRPAVGNFLIEDSGVTLLRFDCSDDKYSLLIAEGKTVPGPETGGPTAMWSSRTGRKSSTRSSRGPTSTMWRAYISTSPRYCTRRASTCPAWRPTRGAFRGRGFKAPEITEKKKAVTLTAAAFPLSKHSFPRLRRQNGSGIIIR